MEGVEHIVGDERALARSARGGGYSTPEAISGWAAIALGAHHDVPRGAHTGMPASVIACDVGGTTVSAGVVAAATGEPVGPIEIIDSPGGGDARHVLTVLTALLRRQGERSMRWGLEPVVVGVGMPGPFEYAAGIGLRTQGKFASLQGINVRRSLEAGVELPVFMCNDAVAYATGAWRAEHASCERFVGVVLSTGSGAIFLENGRAAAPRAGAPIDAGIDCFSVTRQGEAAVRAWAPAHEIAWFHPREALEGGYERETGMRRSVQSLAVAARGGDRVALSLFHALGSAWGEVLARLTGVFRPEVIALGGQVARSFDILSAPLRAQYDAIAVQPAVIQETSGLHLALAGAASFAWSAQQ